MRNVFRSACLALSLVVLMISSAMAAEHTLMPSPRTVHIGHFQATNRPVLTINSGDIVTLEAATQLEPEAIDASGVVAPSVVPQYVRDIYRDVTDRGPGPHVLTGPIFVNGAMPGDVLELRILAVDLAVGYGYNRQRPFAGALPNEFTQVWQRVLRIDREAKTTEIAPGVVIPLDRPFFGTMGVAPPAVMGRIGSGPPGVHTGNLCRRCGSHLFYYLKPNGQYSMCVGAFDDEAPFALVGEIYVDHQPRGYAFAGDLERLTEAQVLALYGSPDEGR